MRRRPLVLTLVVAVVLTVVLGASLLVVRILDDGPDTRLAAAMELAPPDALRYGWTDWAAVRAEVGVGESEDEVGGVGRLLRRAFDADLSPMSALVSSAPVLEAEYGVSPASLEWELFAQSEVGAVVLLGLPDDLDLDELRDRLTGLGYLEPERADGVWEGGAELLTGLGSLTPELTHLRLDEEHRVLAASDQVATLEDLAEQDRGAVDTTAVDAPDDSAGGIDLVVAALGDQLGEPTAAAIYSGPQACAALAMTQADPETQAEAAALIADAGDVTAYDAYGIGVGEDEAGVAMAFEDADDARTNADTRSVLASGAAPGQGGSFADRFTLDEVAAEDRLLTLDLTPVRGAFVLSELSAGPVLFATC